jgi:hypothetical protein
VSCLEPTWQQPSPPQREVPQGRRLVTKQWKSEVHGAQRQNQTNDP